MKTTKLGYDPTKKRIVLEVDRQPEIRETLARLHHKTGMNNSVDIVRLALKQLDANLPSPPKDAPPAQ
ncbi:hypothetical protein EN866_19390 [Mesorhizobium sp. M2D.F.Ca.ET.223.01.1.1]|uniref:hypothetical protein n=1 Tax=unclassified Mesorhizobium TaxID=325217 RepID=UPI000FCBAA40|nr:MULTISPECIES: hypothetical protein [unclassified Mesorhizobium]TGP89325.1 hypothetical protein EN864_19400 [bacterium M00.F.Ca.ET.221.01.1.1]TGP94698.1 hypothetical protein EN865_15270 [bacterium M00.F.Ca.ET.222.01.1.1]RVD58888.1 hypothetical protein EN783_14725 [Mesorhizobium sp. M2D.F.Ca.ET.140.01.1.1]TGP27917.1 hypothetical protein EN875_033210 [Mesorhizobium sp. M2D.F.Ca.ET.232.01.1.1]TGP75866.1 hypothetical protein EN867_15270 [Mesorhizobium sp. M2D.F.Ca.ET.224.01.1.1]